MKNIKKQNMSISEIDKDGAIAILVLQLGSDFDSTQLFLDAVCQGNIELVKLLLASELVDVHVRNDRALRCASNKGHEEVVNLLLEVGANVHADDDSALRWASREGHLEVVKFLLESGANVHANNGQALQLAIEYGHMEVVQFLKEYMFREGEV